MGDQVKGHTKVLAIMNTDVMVRPATLMVSKVTVNNNRYTNILMGTVQGAIANGVLDAVRAGDIPKERANDLGIIVSVWLNPGVSEDDNAGPQSPVRHPPQGDRPGDPQGDGQRAVNRLAARAPGRDRPQVLSNGPGR